MKLLALVLCAFWIVASAQVPPRPPVVPPQATDARLSKLNDVVSAQTDVIRALNDRVDSMESRLAALEGKAKKKNGR